MHVFCTYCSATKSRDPGELPAISRYRSTRIQRIHDAAAQAGVGYFILSGRFGLAPPQRPLPYYDHLLQPDEVPTLAELVSSQIREYGIRGVVYFTKSLQSSANLVPYRDVIVTACIRAAIACHVIDLEENDMGNWREIMQTADDAKLAMISDRSTGEGQFESLLRQYPRDGMIYFKRGEAYEAIGDRARAASDFQSAFALFPMPEWKRRAQEALERVNG